MGLIDIVFFILYGTVLNCVYFWPNIVFNPVEKFKKKSKIYYCHYYYENQHPSNILSR